MIGRLMVGAGVLGVGAVHQLAALPDVKALVLLAGTMLVVPLALPAIGMRLAPFTPGINLPTLCRWLAGCLVAAMVGFLYTAVAAQVRLSDVLSPGNVDRVSRVVLRIEGLPKLEPDRVSFEATVLQAHPAGVPRRVRVTWAASGWKSPYAAPVLADPPFPVVRAGQVWQMALVLRPVHASQNPSAFDYERHLFAAGVRALGTVRGAPHHLGDDGWSSLAIIAARVRHSVRQAMDPHLQGLRYGPVLRALAIGDQDGMDDADWRVFNRSGLTHLVSISGSHITMLAGLAALATSWLWRRLTWRRRALAERWPARRAASGVAMLVAWLYCLLAGWGVPAQRTFMMLAVVALAHFLQVRISASRILALAAVVVLVLDPWALLASGFWLSFLAVAVLLAVGANVADRTTQTDAGGRSAGFPAVQVHARESGRHEDQERMHGAAAASARKRAGRAQRWRAALAAAARLQWAVTWALAPALAWLFHEVSLVSPLANAYAIPLIELLVTPMSLLLAGTALVPGMEVVAGWLAQLAHGLLSLMMVPTEWLAALPTIPVAAGPLWLYALAYIGVTLALWPVGSTKKGPGGVVMPWPVAWVPGPGGIRTSGPCSILASRVGGSGLAGFAGCLGPRPAGPRWWHPRPSWGWLALLPMMLWRPDAPAQGEWDLYATDVGQGSSVLLRTARHALLFDTGARHARTSDEGERTVLPTLRSLGVSRLDALVVSHADLDHAGGTRSVLGGIAVEQAYSSFALAPWLADEARKMDAPPSAMPLAATACLFGGRWQVDGVSFEFLWPLDRQRRRRGAQANADSCVLRVRGRHHSLLLTGDIDARTESRLVLRGLTPVDVVIAAHHGSKTSSSSAFVETVSAGHVIIQAGRWNRHGHPDSGVLARWDQAGTRIWRTDRHGSIRATSRADGLVLRAQREMARRYWHESRF